MTRKSSITGLGFLPAITIVLTLGSWTMSAANGAATTLTVVTLSEEINGDTSSPDALVASPGPDGISLPEAMEAANQVQGFRLIEFDATLSGGSIVVTGGLPTISSPGVTIDGDIDGDGDPDITIDGSGASSHMGIQIRASETTIIGLDIWGFFKHGLYISTDADYGVTEVSNVEIRNCRVNTSWAAIAIHIWQQEDCTLRDIVIRDNELLMSRSGVSISAASGVANRNQILDVTVVGNTISNSTSGIAIGASAGQDWANSNNLVQGLDIVDNTMVGHDDVSVLIHAGGASCQFNRIDEVLIAENTIDGTSVTMELVGGSGGGSTDNVVSNVSILHNQLTGGGVQLSTGYDSTAINNRIEDITIGWNSISGCAANGVMAVAGSTGASWNTIQRVEVIDNLIVDSNDAGILLHGNDGTSPNNLIDDIDIVNNTIIDNGNSWAGGININSKHSSNLITDIAISSTILWGNSGDDAFRGSIAPSTVTYCLLGDLRYVGSDGNFYDNPLFVEPATMSYQLQELSPAIDVGDPSAVGAGDYDLDLGVRIWDGDDDLTATVDIGAYEYGAPAFPIDNHTLTVTKSGSGGGTVTSTPAGINCGGDCTEDYDYGTLISLTATPTEGSTFTGWSGGGCSGIGTCHVSMDGAKSVDAEFALETHTLTVTRSGSGGGTVTSTPAGINCGGDCTEDYNYGTSVTLTATPTQGSTFTGWSGGGCSGIGTCQVSMDGAKSVDADFTLETLTLTVTRSGNGDGIVTSTPAGIDCGSDCTEDYDYGTSVTLTATPAQGSTFTGWSGGGCSGTGTCQVSMDGAKSVDADFDLSDPDPVFADGFESGDTTAWSRTVP